MYVTYVSDRYFLCVCCFIVFNVMDLIGRSVTSMVQWVSLTFLPSVCLSLLPITAFNCCSNASEYVSLPNRVSLSLSVPQPSKRSRLFPVLVVSRVVFIPLIMLCKTDNRQYLPVLFSHDIAFVAIMTLFALSNGYLICLCMSYAPQWVTQLISSRNLFNTFVRLFH